MVSQGPGHILQHWVCLTTWNLFNSSNFAVSAALVEACSLLSAILVIIVDACTEV